MARRIVSFALIAALALFAILQLVPYRVHNPPVRQEPTWDRPETRALAKRACFDCHSNETVVPWYGHIAPFAWAVRDHVDEGRAALNFSEWDRPQEEAHEAAEEVQEGEMPPAYYLALHGSARLTPSEQQALVAGLEATLGGEEASDEAHASVHRPRHDDRHDDHEHDDHDD